MSDGHIKVLLAECAATRSCDSRSLSGCAVSEAESGHCMLLYDCVCLTCAPSILPGISTYYRLILKMNCYDRIMRRRLNTSMPWHYERELLMERGDLRPAVDSDNDVGDDCTAA